MDHYGTIENVIQAFKDFIHLLDPQTGLAVLCADNDKIRAFLPEVKRPFVTYAIEAPADYKAKNIGYH